MKATVSLYLDTRRAKVNGKYPVKLRIYVNGKTKFYPIKEDLTEIEFNNAYQSKKPRREYRDMKLKLQLIESRAANVADDIEPFSFVKFEKKMFRSTGDASNVVYYYNEYIKQLRTEDRHGTANSYDNSLCSIRSFINANGSLELDHISFDEIAPEFLTRYEKWMLKSGKSLTTVGIYLRALRGIFNLAIEEGDIPREIYPFGRRKYKIPAGRNVKKALDKVALKTLHTYKLPKDSPQAKARDFWFFSYQCNGMNVRDILELKNRDVEENVITFRRTKTKNTTKTDLKPIIVPITGTVMEIIERHGSISTDKQAYVFPILSDGITELEKRRRTMNFTKFINQHLKKLAEAAGVTTDISTYWARHSYTTTSMRNGASLEQMQEDLGHQDMKTTMNYWSGFEDSVKRKMAKKLMKF